MFIFSKEQVSDDISLIERFVEDVNNEVKLLKDEK